YCASAAERSRGEDSTGTQLMAVIPSGVENGAAWEAATWTGRPKAERVGSERIKSLDASEGARDVSTSLDMTTRLFASLHVYHGHVAFATRAVTASGYSCFANPVRADVMIDGRKVAGAAQRRTRSGLLQQGSIQSVDLGNGLAQRFAKALSENCSERKINEE